MAELSEERKAQIRAEEDYRRQVRRERRGPKRWPWALILGGVVLAGWAWSAGFRPSLPAWGREVSATLEPTGPPLRAADWQPEGGRALLARLEASAPEPSPAAPPAATEPRPEPAPARPATPPPPPAPTVAFRGLRIPQPTGWTVQSEADWVELKAPEARGVIGVLVDEMPGMTLSEIEAELAGEFDSTGAIQRILVDGREALLAEIGVDGPDGWEQGLALVLPVGDELFLVQCAAAPGAWEEFEPQFRRLIEGIRIGG